jgi:hypothetical protein
MKRSSRRTQFRARLLVAALFFFVASVGVSSLFMLFGGNSISGDNIAVDITGPFTVGGGEELALQVGITNQNPVPIESATLIVTYPRGTQSVDDSGRELFVERLPLDTIASNETINVPLRAVVFGEENEEHSVQVSVEYRVRGSNATFYRDAEPLTFKISSSPVVLRIDAVEKLASGQETDITLTVRSNAPNPLTNLLVEASYPSGFAYREASPRPVRSNNVWRIDSLEPEETYTITLRGALRGDTSDELVLSASVGVPGERDRFALASIFALTTTEFQIEEAFLDVAVLVDNARNTSATVPIGRQTGASVVIENTLGSIIYDGVVTLNFAGNALAGSDISVSDGFYNSNTNTIVWDISTNPDLESIEPGETKRFNFIIRPGNTSVNEPQIDLTAEVRARRVSERQAQEELLGSVDAAIKVETNLTLLAETGHGSGAFTDTGPVPPEVGEETTYTISLLVANAQNTATDVALTATLPPYVDWLDETAGAGSVTFNPTTRAVEWAVGSLTAGGEAAASFQVAITPSASQLGSEPQLTSTMQIRATDAFTGTTVRAEHSALTTALADDGAFGSDNGEVTN